MHREKYPVVVYWSEEDRAFIAEAPDLAGCAADGSTREEAVTAVERVISEWIETAKELGRPVPGLSDPFRLFAWRPE